MTSRVITLAMPVLVNFIILLVWLFNFEYENVLLGKKKANHLFYNNYNNIIFWIHELGCKACEEKTTILSTV